MTPVDAAGQQDCATPTGINTLGVGELGTAVRFTCCGVFPPPLLCCGALSVKNADLTDRNVNKHRALNYVLLVLYVTHHSLTCQRDLRVLGGCVVVGMVVVSRAIGCRGTGRSLSKYVPRFFATPDGAPAPPHAPEPRAGNDYTHTP